MKILRAADHQRDWPMTVAVLLAGLVFGIAVRRAATLAEISSDEWRCTATHAEQQPVDTAQGVTYRTVQACDQWTRR